MEFGAPSFSRGRIDKAGDTVLQAGEPPSLADYTIALGVVDDWRASHSYPLQIIRKTLTNRAKRVSSGAIVAQRLKRLESIVNKLGREPHMKLSQMQDLGGCRAIMPTVAEVDELVRIHKDAWDKAPSRHELHHFKEYVANPKASGYRSVHLIYKFRTENPNRAAHNGQGRVLRRADRRTGGGDAQRVQPGTVRRRATGVLQPRRSEVPAPSY